MDQNIFNLNNKIYSNNNNILLEIVNDLHQLMNYSKDNIIIKTLGNIINKMNYIINENKKNLELIRNDINKLYHKFDNLNINNKSNQELQFYDGKYIGCTYNGAREGKGIMYYNSGNRYEGDWKNDNKEGKGIKYWNDGDRDMGDYRNDEPIGKHARLTKNGEVINKKEKEFIIIIMVVDMKVIGKMI